MWKWGICFPLQPMNTRCFLLHAVANAPNAFYCTLDNYILQLANHWCLKVFLLSNRDTRGWRGWHWPPAKHTVWFTCGSLNANYKLGSLTCQGDWLRHWTADLSIPPIPKTILHCFRLAERQLLINNFEKAVTTSFFFSNHFLICLKFGIKCNTLSCIKA